jgi:hypothetical protein
MFRTEMARSNSVTFWSGWRNYPCLDVRTYENCCLDNGPFYVFFSNLLAPGSHTQVRVQAYERKIHHLRLSIVRLPIFHSVDGL